MEFQDVFNSEFRMKGKLCFQTLNISGFVTSLLITAIIAALTIGGKAVGKSIAINKSTTILYEFSKFISYIYNFKNK